MRKFFNDDEGYVSWGQENRTGFVFNFFGSSDAQAEMNKVHRAECWRLWTAKDEGKRTTRYEKVCSNSFEELMAFVKGKRGDSWSNCKTCKPAE